MTPDIRLENRVADAQLKTDQNFSKIIRLLFGIGVIGQWLFVYYIVVFYGGIVLNNTYEKVNEQLVHGIIAGDTMGNWMLAIHIFLAAIIVFGGPIQFFQSVRRRFPTFHRWNGRIYFVTAFLIALAGLYMIYTRGAHGGLPMLLGNSLNAVLIMTFSALAWRSAMARDFKAHKRWAIRAFIMVSGVWFFRVGYGLWILLTGFTAPGTTMDLNGPFDIFLAFGHSLVPLAIIEYYFWTKRQNNPRVVKTATRIFGLLSLLLAGGIAMAAFIFWAPAF